MLGMPVVFDYPAALGMYRQGQVTSFRKAHKVLAAWRAQHTVRGQTAVDDFDMEAEDITHSAFDWRGYVANRPPPAIEQVVGEGITHVELRFLSRIDANTGGHRVDFLLYRADGSGCRLHPGSAKDAWLVLGPVATMWHIGAGTLGIAADQPIGPNAPPAPEGLGNAYRIISQHDRLSRRDAWWFLDHCTSLAEQAGWPRHSFRRNITDEREFAWVAYLGGGLGAAGVEILRAGVREVEVVWQGAPFHRAAYHIKMHDGVEYAHHPAERHPFDQSDGLRSINWAA